MKDLLNKFIPSLSKKEGMLPKYSHKKRNKLITIGILSAVSITVGVYLFITFNPLKSSVTSLAETPDIAFSQFHKQIKAGNRKGIIERISKSFKGDATHKREVIKSFETLKGSNYKIDKKSSTTKGNIHVFTYDISVADKSITIANETWQLSPEESKWYLLKEGEQFEQMASLLSSSQIEAVSNAESTEKVVFDVERVVPDGASILLGLSELGQTHQLLEKTAFYRELTSILKKNGLSDTEFSLLEKAITTLFGQSTVFARYDASNNFLITSKISEAVKVIAPITEDALNIFDKNIKISSTPYRNTEIKTIQSGANKTFYALSKNFLHVSDSELLLKKSLELADIKRDESVLNNTEVFSYLTELKPGYKFYLLGASGTKTVPTYFSYGYFEGGLLQTKTVFSGENKNTVNAEKNAITGEEAFFSLLPANAYGFIASSLGLSSETIGLLPPSTIKSIDEALGLASSDLFTNKMLFALLPGSGTGIYDFYFPVFIAEMQNNGAEKIVRAIAEKDGLQVKTLEGSNYVSYNIAPKYDMIFSSVNNNLVVTVGEPAFKEISNTLLNKHPNYKKNQNYSSLFTKNTSVKLAYIVELNSLLYSLSEIYSRSNIDISQNNHLSKHDLLSLFSLVSCLQEISGKGTLINGQLTYNTSVKLKDIDIDQLRKQTAEFAKKGDLNVQGAFTPLIEASRKLVKSSPSSSSIVAEKTIEGFKYVSRNKRDPFSPSYLISQINYEKELSGNREAESLYKEMEQESTRLQEELLKPIVFDEFLLDLIKTNDPQEYRRVSYYANLLKKDDSVNIETFEQRKRDILAYNELFNALKRKYEEALLDRNKLPHNPLKSLRLKGIATGSLGSKALVIAGDLGYFISEGDYIGTEFFLVDKITSGSMVLVKKSFDYKLTPSPQEQILRIK